MVLRIVCIRWCTVRVGECGFGDLRRDTVLRYWSSKRGWNSGFADEFGIREKLIDLDFSHSFARGRGWYGKDLFSRGRKQSYGGLDLFVERVRCLSQRQYTSIVGMMRRDCEGRSVVCYYRHTRLD